MGVCYSCVDQGTVEIVERFGKFHRVAYPGFNCVCCLLGEQSSSGRSLVAVFVEALSPKEGAISTRAQSLYKACLALLVFLRSAPVCALRFSIRACIAGEMSAGRLNMRIQQLDVGCETKTRDNVFVKIIISVQYQVRTLQANLESSPTRANLHAVCPSSIACASDSAENRSGCALHQSPCVEESRHNVCCEDRKLSAAATAKDHLSGRPRACAVAVVLAPFKGP